MRVGIMGALGWLGLATASCISTGSDRPPDVDSLGDSSTGNDSLTLGSLVTGIDDSPGSDAGPAETMSGATSGDTGSDGDTATSGSDSEGSGSGSDDTTATTGETVDLPEYCDETVPMSGADPLIDDLELEGGQMLPDDQIPAIDGRVGFWFTYNDGSPAGDQTPTPGSFQPSMGGAAGSDYSAGTFGMGFVTWGAGLGVKLNNDFSGDCPYDASGFDGITFQARGDVTARVSITTRATHPIESGGTCDPARGQCSDHFGALLVLEPDWQTYALSWADLTQQGWGTPAEFDPSRIIEIQWQVPVAVPFDIRVDELEFLSP